MRAGTVTAVTVPIVESGRSGHSGVREPSYTAVGRQKNFKKYGLFRSPEPRASFLTVCHRPKTERKTVWGRYECGSRNLKLGDSKSVLYARIVCVPIFKRFMLNLIINNVLSIVSCLDVDNLTVTTPIDEGSR